MLKNPKDVVPLLLAQKKKNFQMFMKHQVDANKLKFMAIVLVGVLYAQLKYSSQARAWAKHFGQAGLFAGTALGILATFGSIMVKSKVDKDWKKIQEEHQKSNRHVPIVAKFKREDFF
jgi:hypothetical protein